MKTIRMTAIRIENARSRAQESAPQNAALAGCASGCGAAGAAGSVWKFSFSSIQLLGYYRRSRARRVSATLLLVFGGFPARGSNETLFQQSGKQGQRPGPLLQRAVVKIRKPERRALFLFVLIAHLVPRPPTQEIHRQLAGRKLGPLQLAFGFFLLLHRLLLHPVE